jgi:hypothetical protein
VGIERAAWVGRKEAEELSGAVIGVGLAH